MSRLLPSLPDSTPEDRDPRVVGVDDDDAEDVISALGSETARNALSALHEEPATTSELADELDTSLQNVQYHLSKLSEADVVDVVDTTYSEKGREMNVYAPTDEPLVLFAGGSEESTGIKTALKKLLGGYGIIGLAALATQEAFTSFLSETATGGADDAPAATADEDAADDDVGFAAEESDEAGDVEEDVAADEDVDDFDSAADVEPDDGFAIEDSASERADLLVDIAEVLAEPGVVFFLGAGLVFTLAWAYWYRSKR
ncbi:DNA-binding transcriptional ArsR family regulator [Halorubrum alkaliphilum]|uniref:DNA-binding transcriptional ArsR family regulator n=1 Tax=Halorubrum alkaliphilum TaxID=261290 RepID=A0A8T4GDG0_9EURY|nr:helix-turn-helix domain-containing protein [Halorubrum alkaliphilum]MBP1922478.1 DNA-binding transcriptional ArsR family regulator [Halorubrum alkaliphilum]